MGDLLIISDDLDRASSIETKLSPLIACKVYDLYGQNTDIQAINVILFDVGVLTYGAMRRLQNIHLRIPRGDTPRVFILHEDCVQARACAAALHATEIVAFLNIERLPALIERVVVETGQVPISAVQHATRARQFLREVFLTGTLTPSEVQTGTELVAQAISTAGIYDWIRAVRTFDDATHQHILLVAGLGAAFAGTLGLSVEDRHALTRAALLHDIGKTTVPAAILNKPGKLDAAEMAIMRTHAAAGHAMLIGKGFEPDLMRVVRSHHEMLDGSGYPDGLIAHEIPDMVRLITVCDVYGALIERRPYRTPLVAERAYDILEGMTGRLDQFLVRAFRPVVLPAVANEPFTVPSKGLPGAGHILQSAV